MVSFNSLKDWLDWQEFSSPGKVKLGLEKATEVYHRLIEEDGAQQPLTVTVAGTNGKGSCVAFLETIYRHQGYRVGAYTSPHILRYNERIKICGNYASDDQICQAFERIDSIRGNTRLSYFEFGTLAALDLFRRQQVDVQILEVGLGGRLDAVNIVNPDAAIVTNIDIDHTDWLGTTRESIAKEKAGIFRTGIPAIVGDDRPPRSLIAYATEQLAPVYCIDDAFGFVKKAESWNWHFRDKLLTDLPFPALRGEHQLANASTALAAVHLLNKRLPVDKSSIINGMKQIELAGRFQWIEANVPTLLDVGHNRQAAQNFHKYIVTYYPHKRVHAVFTMMKDKDIEGVIQILKPIIYHWYIAPIDYHRAADECMISNYFKKQNITNFSFGFRHLADAYAAAEKNSQSGDMISVFGSFYLVSEFLAMSQ